MEGGAGCRPGSQAQQVAEDHSELRGRIGALWEGRAIFSFLLPLGKRIGKAGPEVAGMGESLQRGNSPQDRHWQPEGGR